MEDLTSYVEDMRATLQEGTIGEQKAFIKKFVGEIIINA